MSGSDAPPDPAKGIEPSHPSEEKVEIYWGRILLTVLCLCLVLHVFFPASILYLTFTIIGIPIAALVLAAPTLLFYVFLFWALHKQMRKSFEDQMAAAAASVVLILAFVIPPSYFYNHWVEERLPALIAEDHNDISLPVKVKTIALRQEHFGLGCGGFCLYALLSGAAERVLLVRASVADLWADETASQKIVAYRLVENEHCVPPDKWDGFALFGFESGKTTNGQTIKLKSEMLRRMGHGQCLVKEAEADITDADLIITLQSQWHGQGGVWKHVDYLRASSRILVHQRNETGQGMKEIYRWTGGFYDRKWPIVVLNFIARHSSITWMGSKTPIAEGHGIMDREIWSHFLEEILQFRLPSKGENPV